MVTLAPASAKPTKPRRISETPSPVLPSCARVQPTTLRLGPEERKAMLLGNG